MKNYKVRVMWPACKGDYPKWAEEETVRDMDDVIAEGGSVKLIRYSNNNEPVVVSTYPAALTIITPTL